MPIAKILKTRFLNVIWLLVLYIPHESVFHYKFNDAQFLNITPLFILPVLLASSFAPALVICNGNSSTDKYICITIIP